MKIGFVNTSYQLGGVETVVRDLLDGCSSAGIAARLYIAAGKQYPDDSRLVPLYPRVFSRLHHSRLRPVLDRVAPRHRWTDRRFRALAGGWPDLLHVHNFHGDWATVESLGAVARRKPLVWSLHGHWGITGGCEHPIDCTRFESACGQCPRVGVWPVGPVDDTAERLEEKARHLADAPLRVITPAQFVAARIARSRVGRRWEVHHVPNGVDIAAFSSARRRDPRFRQALGLEPDATTVLVVNRHFGDSQKGFALVRDALAAVPDDWRVQVLLAGTASAPAAATLPARLRPLSAGYVSSRPEVSRLFEAADVFLFGSPAETFPCVVLEAMAASCCVVTTPTSGVTEQVENGRTAIVATAITGAALGRALLAARDAELRARLGGAARDHVSAEFSTERMVRRHLHVYAGVLRERTAGRAPAECRRAAVTVRPGAR